MSLACDEIDDIEDLIAPGDLKPSDRYYNKKDVTVRGKKKKEGKIKATKTITEVQIGNGNVACESVSCELMKLNHLLTVNLLFRSYLERRQST